MDTLKGKKVIITGGLGYVGVFLSKKLHEIESEIHVFDIKDPDQNKLIPGVTYHKINLLEYDLLFDLIKEIKPEKIFHLAAHLNRDRDYDKINCILDINLKGTNNLLRALKNINYTSFVYTSTSEVYGNQVKKPFSEEMALQPSSPYSLSKACAEMSIQTFSAIYKKPYTILRLFNLYGPDLPENFFLPQLLEALKKNNEFNMTKGEQKRDFIYIDDIIKALIIASINEDAENQIFNICSGNSISLYELSSTIKNMLLSKATINYGAISYRENEIWNMVGDNDKAKKILSFECQHSLIENLRIMING